MRYLIITIITFMAVLQAAELPDGAFRILRSMEVEIARERVRAVSSLEKELAKAMKAQKLEEAIQIQTLIDEQNALIPQTEADLNRGTPMARMAGQRKVDSKGDYWFFRADGTFDCPGWGGGHGEWEIKDGLILINCSNGVRLVCNYVSDDLWTEQGKNANWRLVK